MSRAERLASSALWNFLGSRDSASAVADLVRVESTRVSLSFPLFPSLTDELLRRVPVSAVRLFPYTVGEGRDDRAGTHTCTQIDNLGNNRGDTRGANLGGSIDI